MRKISRKIKTIVCIVIFLLLFLSYFSTVKAGKSLSLRTSVLTRHWESNKKYNNSQGLIGLEFRKGESSIGVNYFENSYENDAYYVFIGRNLANISFNTKNHLKIKLTGGIIGGYKKENISEHALKVYDQKFLVVIPVIGLQHNLTERYSLTLETSLLGDVGFISTSGIKINF